jgi:RNA polymerase sigma-70 factor (family 1)
MENLDAIKAGCITTFKMIYYQYHPKLYAYLIKKTSSTYIAEEVVQLTFIKLWNNRLNVSNDFSIDIQLFRIARTTLVDELRRDVVRNNYINNLEKTIAQPYTDRLAERDTLKHVTEAIEQLPPARKMVFKLSRFNYLSNLEIAQMLAISPKTVENHITLAIKQLRKAAIISLPFLSVMETILINC